MFHLHPQLQQDTIIMGSFSLSCLLLMNDANYPWFILVPQREGIEELYQLTELDQVLLARESAYLARQLAAEFNADKMNVAALGNVVPQLHVHHIVRYKDDPAWPAPVWGKLAAKPYDKSAIEVIKQKLREILREGYSGLD